MTAQGEDGGDGRPVVWLLTHEGHGGGRILAPIAAYQEMGWAVRLFHDVQMPARFMTRDPHIRVPAFDWRTVVLRLRSFEQCPFASLTRLVAPVRAFLRNGPAGGGRPPEGAPGPRAVPGQGMVLLGYR